MYMKFIMNKFFISAFLVVVWAMQSPTPGTRDANRDLPFGKGPRAPDDWKKASFSEGSSGGQGSFKNERVGTHSSMNADHGSEAMPPQMRGMANKRKMGQQTQVYKKVVPQLENALAVVGGEKGLITFVKGSEVTKEGTILLDGDSENDSNKKRKTPSIFENSAKVVMQPCLSQ
jgi:hypothetical protein